jgi:hypothetical protein
MTDRECVHGSIEGLCPTCKTSSDMGGDEFAALHRLQPDWDSYGAAEIDRDCIMISRDLLRVINAGGFPKGWSIVPMSSGGVQLESHVAGFDIEISVEKSK